MIRDFKLSIITLFGVISFRVIQNAKGVADGLGIWFLPVSLMLIILPVLYFVVQIFRRKMNR